MYDNSHGKPVAVILLVSYLHEDSEKLCKYRRKTSRKTLERLPKIRLIFSERSGKTERKILERQGKKVKRFGKDGRHFPEEPEKDRKKCPKPPKNRHFPRKTERKIIKNIGQILQKSRKNSGKASKDF